MHRLAPKYRLAALAAALLSLAACTDVGDTTPTTPENTPDASVDSSLGPQGADASADSSADRTESSADASVDSSSDGTVDGLGADSTIDSTVGGGGQDAGMDSPVVTASPEASAPDMGAPAPDAGTPEETGTPDTGAVDAGAPDMGLPDMGSPETGAPEAGPPDAAHDAVADTSAPDTGVSDSGVPDTGAPDTGSPDTGAEAGPPPDCTANNGGAPCTPTEALFAAHSASCYQCLVNGGCLNDVINTDMGHECSDVPGNAARGSMTGTPRSTLCLDTIQCILQTGCASADYSICYCGSLGQGNLCTQSTDPTAPNGACAQVELAAAEHPATDPPTAVVLDLTNASLGAGKANLIFDCGKKALCTTCAQ